jgi:hypothetical protein
MAEMMFMTFIHNGSRFVRAQAVHKLEKPGFIGENLEFDLEFALSPMISHGIPYLMND